MRNSETEILRAQEFIAQQISEHRANVLSNDPAKQLASTQHFRRLLSIGKFIFHPVLHVLSLPSY